MNNKRNLHATPNNYQSYNSHEPKKLYKLEMEWEKDIGRKSYFLLAFTHCIFNMGRFIKLSFAVLLLWLALCIYYSNDF